MSYNQYFSEVTRTLHELEQTVEAGDVKKALELSKKLENPEFYNVFAGEPELRNWHTKIIRRIVKLINPLEE